MSIKEARSFRIRFSPEPQRTLRAPRSFTDLPKREHRMRVRAPRPEFLADLTETLNGELATIELARSHRAGNITTKGKDRNRDWEAVERQSLRTIRRLRLVHKLRMQEDMRTAARISEVLST